MNQLLVTEADVQPGPATPSFESFESTMQKESMFVAGVPTSAQPSFVKFVSEGVAVELFASCAAHCDAALPAAASAALCFA
jgi:hypothetical protein